MPDRTKTYDVLVAGGGNAALCAAITARQAGATRAAGGVRPQGVPRRQQPPHPQPARHARPAERRADRRLQGGRILGRPAARHRRQHRRSARPHDHPRFLRPVRLDEAGRRPLPAVADRDAEPRPHQRLLPRRRQGAGERLLSHRRTPGRRHPLRHRGRQHEPGRRLRPLRSTSPTKASRKPSTPAASSPLPAASRPTSTGCANTGATPSTTSSSAARPTTAAAS